MLDRNTETFMRESQFKLINKGFIKRFLFIDNANVKKMLQPLIISSFFKAQSKS